MTILGARVTIELVRSVTIAVFVVATVAFASAGQARSTKEPTYTAADFPRILAVKFKPFSAPDEEGTGPITLADLRDSTVPGNKVFVDKLRKAGFQRGYTKSWSAGIAFAQAFAFGSAPGAHAALRAFQTYDRPSSLALWGRSAERVPAKGLGQEAWGAKQNDASGLIGAHYYWRRGNLVLAAYIECENGCDFAVRAARVYANAIDARAKQAGTR